jgi:hypothetical protein
MTQSLNYSSTAFSCTQNIMNNLGYFFASVVAITFVGDVGNAAQVLNFLDEGGIPVSLCHSHLVGRR